MKCLTCDNRTIGKRKCSRCVKTELEEIRESEAQLQQNILTGTPGKIKFRNEGVLLSTPFETVATNKMYMKFMEWKKRRGISLNTLDE